MEAMKARRQQELEQVLPAPLTAASRQEQPPGTNAQEMYMILTDVGELTGPILMPLVAKPLKKPSKLEEKET